MNYSLHPEAEEDLRAAAKFYRERAGKSLAQSFLTEFENSLTALLRHPGMGSSWKVRGRRRYLMKRFPYSLVYMVSGQEIRVLAVAHHSRRPGYWLGRK